MELTVNVPDAALRIRDLLGVVQNLAYGMTDRGPVASTALRDAIDAATFEAGRNVANYALVSIEEQMI